MVRRVDLLHRDELRQLSRPSKTNCTSALSGSLLLIPWLSGGPAPYLGSCAHPHRPPPCSRIHAVGTVMAVSADVSQKRRNVPDPLHRDWLSLIGAQVSASPKTTLRDKSSRFETPLCRLLDTSRGRSQKLPEARKVVPESTDSGTLPPLRGVGFPPSRSICASDLPEARHRSRRSPWTASTGARRRRGPPAGSGVVRPASTVRATDQPPQGPDRVEGPHGSTGGRPLPSRRRSR